LNDPIVGIDLGTSNSVVAHAEATGTVTVLSDEAGGKVHPSVVSFHPSGGVVVGAAAKQRKVIDPQNTIYSIKRLIGRSYRSAEVQTARARSPFKIKEGPNSAPIIVTRAGEFAVPEISAIVLDHVRNLAAARLEASVSRAVVTVPASFNDAQRSATATAGAIAGLTVVRVLNEPTAAALAYGHARRLREIIAVYDFGGGTFDVTILKLEDQVYEVLGTAGDSFLGGDDLDERLVEKMAAKFLAENRIDLRPNPVAMMRLRAVAEQTKIELSRRTRAVVRVDEIAHGARGVPLNLQIEITRDEFVKDTADIIDRTFPVCREALTLASLTIDQIADVILVGGTTKVPYVRDQVGRFFGKPPRTDVNPDDAVAVGAALQATSLERILARRSSSKIAARPPPPTAEQEATARGTDVLELTESGLLPSPPEPSPPDHDRLPRATADHPEVVPSRRDTSYSVTRAGLRDAVADPERYPASPLPMPLPTAPGDPASLSGHTPAPSSQSQSQPLARIMRPAGTASPPPPHGPHGPHNPHNPQNTMLGVPAAPTAPPPPIRGPAPGEWPASAGAAAPNPATTQPMAPTSPIAPPTAPTLIAVAPGVAVATTARGIGAQAITAEPSAGTTARGFQPPQSYPIQPQPQASQAPPPGPTPVLLEVTPRGLGIATVAGFCEELIRRNSRLPTEIRKLFTTSRDQQDLVRIVVCQGESRRIDKNTVIGDLVLQNLPPRPRGETSIEVTFSLDPSGILHVRARDAQTGAEQRATLDLVGGVADENLAVSRDRLQQLRR